MYPLNDKHLDRLSRDAAEHYDVESSTSGWERLESRLDKELPVKEKERRRFLFWLFFIAFLSGGGLVYMVMDSPHNDKLNRSQAPAHSMLVNDSNTQSETKNKAQSNTPPPAGQIEVYNKSKDTGNLVDKTNADLKDLSTDKAVVRNQSGQFINHKRPNKGRLAANANNDRLQVEQHGAENNSSKSKNRTAKDKNTAVVAVTDKQAEESVSRNNSHDTNKDVPVTRSQNDEVPLIDTISHTDATQKNMAPEKNDSVNNTGTLQMAAKKTGIKKNTTSSKWEFGILTGPDFTNVAFKYNYKTGLNIGATIGYRFSERWLLNTGLIYTKKWYKVDGNDFYPPKHSWISYQNIDNVAGSCSMFEFPLNIRYDIFHNKNRRFFSSAGISGYIMDKQDYALTYYSNSGILRKYNWKTDSNYNYLFANLNVSVGYEYAIAKQFSIQAEPYFKLPLQGLGYGSIKMNSYGIYVTFKYKPAEKGRK